ncbi:unnamed protein product [Pedinophyceae sp. YPF-701]|nr:unnamed protein product [Pedinophyceae sp. YPF-701]
MSKRKAAAGLVVMGEGADECEIIPLGAGQEVGRSCVVLRYRDHSVMLDCGIHPGFRGMESLPVFEEVDIASIDACLVTHFHLDHCAAVPHLVGKLDFKGRLLMTHPTKAIYYTLLQDLIKLNRDSGEDALFTDEDLEKSMQLAEVVDFHQEVDIGGIKVVAYKAGHVLGAAMFMVDILGLRVLYTGDYSRIPDRHMAAAEIPPVRPHVVIVESTYGVSSHTPREERERQFTSMVENVVKRGGRVLIPVVALGRAQELLLILEHHWEQNPQIQKVPIYQASHLAKRGLGVYQTYVEMMNDDIRRAFAHSNPFKFSHVNVLSGPSALDDTGPCVVLATPSMLQSGFSRRLLETWCEDSRNGVIIADFAVQGTLAREILGHPKEIPSVVAAPGHKLALRCTVEAISFSAHADFPSTRGFLETLLPDHVVLVHGEKEGMMRLKGALERRAGAKDKDHSWTVHTPALGEAVRFPWRGEVRARIVGHAASDGLVEGHTVSGVLVKPPVGLPTVMHPEDLPAFTKLAQGTVLQRQAIATTKGWPLIRLSLEAMLQEVHSVGAEDLQVKGMPPTAKGEERIQIGDGHTLTYVPGSQTGKAPAQVVLEWVGGARGDLLADVVVAILLGAEGQPHGMGEAETARRKALESGDEDSARRQEERMVACLLQAQFGDCVVLPDDLQKKPGGYNRLLVTGGPGLKAEVDLATQDVEPAADAGPHAKQFVERVAKAATRIFEALGPLSTS